MQRSIGSAREPCERLASDRAARAGDGQPDLPESLYIHVPFCSHKCHYCDFYSVVDTRDRQEAFTARLIREIGSLAPLAGSLRTVFVGGGTPSMLRPSLWQRVLDAMDRELDMSAFRDGSGEFTVECNPETVSSELMAVLEACKWPPSSEMLCYLDFSVSTTGTLAGIKV
ncbi:MAG: radical SAM protein [Planctomycetota bacterium]